MTNEKELVLYCEECNSMLITKENIIWHPYPSLLVTPCNTCQNYIEEDELMTLRDTIERLEVEIDYKSDEIMSLEFQIQELVK